MAKTKGLVSRIKARNRQMRKAAGMKPKYPAGATARDKKSIDARRARERAARKKAGK